MIRTAPLLFAVIWFACDAGYSEEPVGQRPYEMVWANRTDDVRPPLLDFENLEGWTVDCVDAKATLERSQQQQLWGQYVGSLVYHGIGKRPVVVLKPPKPIPIAGPFNCVNLWVCGNNWAWVPDPETPQVEIAVLLLGHTGASVRIVLGRVNWREWSLMHRRLTGEQLSVLKDGASLEGIEVSDGRNAEDRKLHFDNLAFYQEQLPPLEFAKRPIRPFDPCPDGTPGVNVGPEPLPFPTRPQTILPDNLTTGFKTELGKAGESFVFHYRGQDGHLTYRYTPATGVLSDLTAEWEGGDGPFRPLDGGGIRFANPGTPSLPPEKFELVRCGQEGNTVQAVWRAIAGQQTTEVQYTFELVQKSMLITVQSPGGQVGEFCVGKAVGLKNPRLVTLPYLPCDQNRPAVVVAGPLEKPLFVSAFLDYYMSNASSLWAADSVPEEGVAYNGGSRYWPKTDGRRNNCYERLFLTVAPRFEETLPNVANPKSPWMHVAGERLWIAHGASNRQQDYDLWKKIARYGMTKLVITDHETGWRDGGESFTFRTRTAPGRGGDPSQSDYADKLHTLGFRYGIYNNYTDYAPVNEHWSEDCVTRLPDGQWQSAWARCYNPKPARAVEFEAKLAPIIQEKFHLDTAYCDVHTAVMPWQYVDYDARVPRAGTFAATFYAYGEIMLHQKKTWNGPVYSEGNNHWYYCGLTDGNYGQDQSARLSVNPWLVDFDLQKLHPLCCNFGMGNLEMFFGDGQGLGNSPEQHNARLDQFLAATLAFGHTGFLVLDGGMSNTVRSYFALQQVHATYAQETATEIRYADAQGRLLDTSAAVATDAFRRSQVVTRYSNGLVVTVNGHATETWKTAEAVLPPNGWHVKDTRNGKLTAWSAMIDGHRADYVDSPAYRYADGRGRFTRFDGAACDGQLIAHKRENGAMELIPVGSCREFGISLDGQTATAVAIDADGKPLGPAQTRLSRGIVFVTPVPNAFSYAIEPAGPPAFSLQCDRDKVVPGETVRVVGKSEHTFQVPADAAIGSRLWQSFDDAWIDFTIGPVMDAELDASDKLQLKITPHWPTAVDAEVKLDDEVQKASFSPEKATTLDFPLAALKDGEVRQLALQVSGDNFMYRRKWQLSLKQSFLPVVQLTQRYKEGHCLRKEHDKPIQGNSGASVHWSESTCGGITKKALAMHPPYQAGTGYVFALFEPIDLPAAPTSAFRCQVGKGDGSDPGDGILYRVAVVEPDGQLTIVAEKQWAEHAWTALDADLSPWAGRPIQLKLIADVGPADNSVGDWACWADMRVESAQPIPTPEIAEGSH